MNNLLVWVFMIISNVRIVDIEFEASSKQIVVLAEYFQVEY